ncbi:hypothetical protein VJ923_04780 [Adlercreutzia sp. R25]|uniref:Uncharacterized protein n=1 Tax=Adlercreutzia shanghongiae TaxID=3111773 RepID=A0ABU6IXT9_9ACTN|nr:MULTISPECIES: hypothetical protein [unclassified Adlercreutzia]MEC4272477.1 hypothetical protein [Adlercreutzia sp. R25]MEC4294339.1 hypothetical protein [Adlercreutzia sp. R22]
MGEQLTDEQLVEAAIGAVSNVKHEATNEEIAAAIAEIAAERADADDRSGE